MSAISYLLTAGGNLETVTASTNAPSAVGVELRIDTTTTTVTDSGSTRAIKKGEVQQMIRILEEYLLRDTNIPQ